MGKQHPSAATGSKRPGEQQQHAAGQAGPLEKKAKKSISGEIEDIFGKSKSSKKPATQEQTQKDAGCEIEDIFGAVKAKNKPQNPELQSQTTNKGTLDQSQVPKRPKLVGNKDDLFGEETDKSRKRTEEGYRIFSEEELGLNKKGGDTDLCPFDCDCCF